MIKQIFFLIGMFVVYNSNAQSADTAHLYNPKADAEKDIAAAVKKAKAEHKFVLMQAGGNWCIWCKRFSLAVANDAKLDSIVNADFIFYHLNFSSENKNEKLFAQYGYPQRFGFPVFIILDDNGNRIHTQNSEYLEEGKGYSKEKVAEFFEAWSPKALDPASYKD